MSLSGELFKKYTAARDSAWGELEEVEPLVRNMSPTTIRNILAALRLAVKVTKRLLPQFTFCSVVTMRNGVIRIGVNVRLLEAELKNIYGTMRLKNNLFRARQLTSVDIDPFFAVEFMHIFNQMAAETKGSRRRLWLKLARLMYENTWLKEAYEAEPLPVNWKAIEAMDVQLLPNQKSFIEHYANNVPKLRLRGALLGSPPGTGKTIAGYAWGLAFDFDTVIVISPKNAIYDVWEKTIRERFKKLPSYAVSATGMLNFTGKEDYIIVHYEALPLLAAEFKKLRNRRLGIWVDESHSFNESGSNRSEILQQLAQEPDVEGVVWASGTPIKAMGKEVIPILRAVDPFFTQEVMDRYKKAITAPASTQALIQHRLGHVLYTVPKAEIVSNETDEYSVEVRVPDGQQYTLTAVRAEMSKYIEERIVHYKEVGPQMVEDYLAMRERAGVRLKEIGREEEFRHYVERVDLIHVDGPTAIRMDPEMVSWVKRYEADVIESVLSDQVEINHFRKCAPIYKYPILVIRGEALGRILTKKRIECFKALVEHAPLVELVADARKRTLIFSSYVEVVSAATERMRAEGYFPLEVHGTAALPLDTAVAKFRKDQKINPLIATYKSLSTAVPLTEASRLIMVDYPYRDYEYQQATARIDRIGQDGAVEFITLVLDTDEEMNLTTRGKDIMEWSKNMVEFLTGEANLVISPK